MVRRCLLGVCVVVCLLLTTCNAIVTPPPALTPVESVVLTKGATATVAPGFFFTPIPPTPTFTPEPTPTPVIYVIEAGDTLFGVALEYGVSVEAIQKVNGLENANRLSIGQELIIPLDTDVEDLEPQVVVPVGSWLLPTPTPLPLEIAGVGLYQTPVRGVWCMGEVVNTNTNPVTNLKVQVTLLDAEGTSLMTKTTLAAVDYLAEDQRAPFAVLFNDPLAMEAVDAYVTLLRGEFISEITDQFVPLEVGNLRGGISGPQYRVSGDVVNNSSFALERVMVVVTLYDEEDRIIGYRQAILKSDSPFAPGAQRKFYELLTLQVLGEPDDFQVLAWGTRGD